LELLLVSRDVYGREVLQGMSWDLIWVVFGLGVAFIVIHAGYRWLFAGSKSKAAAGDSVTPSDRS
jgi:hypothetical protein